MKQDFHGGASGPGRSLVGDACTTSIHSIRSRCWLLAGLCFSLSSCASVPGDQAYTLRYEQAAVKLPVRVDDASELVPANVAIRSITAELIIEQLKAAAPQRPTATTINLSDRSGNVSIGVAAVPDYKLGAGDIISIIVWDHPELTTPAGQYRAADQAGTVVNEDGTIYFPYVGVLHVAGKNTRQVRDMLASKLSRFIEKVQLDVRMTAFRSKRIYVVGEVLKPGLLEVTDIPMTVLEAVTRAGGVGAEADHSRV